MRLGTARAIDRGILLAGTLTLASKQYDFPSKSFWDHVTAGRSYIVIILICLVGVFGALTPAEALSQRSRLEQRVALRRQILTTFGQLIDIGRSIDPPIEISDLGLHIWRKKRTLRHPWRGELIRVTTYRLGATPMTRAIRPTPGVGVVGLCWQLNSEIGIDIEDLAEKLSNEQDFNDYRRQNGPESVMGFSWREFQRYKHRGAVFATPVRNGRSAFIGCISLDASHGYAELDCRRMWHELNSLSVVLGQDGFQNA